jgi:NAD(P)H-hydrate repair Nnr-like enzyme with NAD(P)H-hydrate epimerase domain
MVDETVTDLARNLRAYCGQGGFGGDGFVALCQADTDDPLWVAFFESSNPFVSVSLLANSVVGKTTLDRKWTFPIENPERCTIE